jgi:hypothetical protein
MTRKREGIEREGGRDRVYIIVFSWNFINVCVSAFSVIIRPIFTSIKIPPGGRDQ